MVIKLRSYKLDISFKSGPSQVCRREPIKKFYLGLSWILGLIACALILSQSRFLTAKKWYVKTLKTVFTDQSFAVSKDDGNRIRTFSKKFSFHFISSFQTIMNTKSLTHFMPLISFDTPWKRPKTSGFLIFLGGIKRDQWHETG